MPAKQKPLTSSPNKTKYERIRRELQNNSISQTRQLQGIQAILYELAHHEVVTVDQPGSELAEKRQQIEEMARDLGVEIAFPDAKPGDQKMRLVTCDKEKVPALQAALNGRLKLLEFVLPKKVHVKGKIELPVFHLDMTGVRAVEQPLNGAGQVIDGQVGNTPALERHARKLENG